MLRELTTRKLVCLLICAGIILPVLSAQTIVTGEISGSISDPSGAAVANAKVTLKNDATGDAQAGSSTNVGEFHFSLLRPGTYTLTALAQGFESTSQRVTVNLGQVTSIKLQLGLQKQSTVDRKSVV